MPTCRWASHRFRISKPIFLNTDLINNALDVKGDGGRAGMRGRRRLRALEYLGSRRSHCCDAGLYADALVVHCLVHRVYCRWIGDRDLGKYGVQLPTASSGVQVNVGTEYREEKFTFKPDYVYADGLASGGANSAYPFSGGVHVWEGFTEMHVPILDKMPGAYNLSFDTGYRFSSYTLGRHHQYVQVPGRIRADRRYPVPRRL